MTLQPVVNYSERHSSSFDPYTDNGGSILAIAGSDYCIVAADTRQSDGGYLINTRYAPKAHKLTDYAVIATSGFHADGMEFTRVLRNEIDAYEYKHLRKITTQSIAQAASTLLYSHRFFPYYTFNIIGGLDENGVGAVYSFDPVGSFERLEYRAGGSAAALIQPLLDNQIGFHNQKSNKKNIPLSLALQIAKDAFTSATERDIYTGDQAEIWIITKDGARLEIFDLKKD